MAVALLALFVALGGGAYAANGLITSASIKNSSVNEIDLSKELRKKINRTLVRGARGPQGPVGPAGAPGVSVSAASGGVSPGKITYVNGPMVVVPSGEIDSAEAYCPPGSKVVGGGGFNSITNYGGGSAIGAANGSGAGWFVLVNNQTLIDIEVNAFAVCLAP